MLLICLASSSLVWSMYSLLTPIRYVLNPWFDLTTPLQSGLLYIAPALRYVVGCQIGGRWADYTVSSMDPEARYPLAGGQTPKQSGLPRLDVARIDGFVWLDARQKGIAQLAAFPSLNAYILDVMQHQNGEASASHYLMRYMFAGLATAVCLPLIEAIGVGWVSTMTARIQFICAGLVYLTIRLGEGWRQTHQLPVPP
ncbi:hypothetical protein CSAL01_00699 [Colletotrichum salicis]|uniref:Uncharacterized protein n=1 Tax=Colletotrichum salicis TaxID=1209931 RepID=A0A135S3N6_9PEZI|nr:hypothetical protein CSAL01_00699 [Colletotrichum salicis]